MENKKHIVIIDDEQDILELLRYNLDKIGYRTTCLLDGESAIKEIRESIPDLILLDLMLPGIDGLDVCRILKNSKQTAKIPIIMITAKGEDTDVVKGLEIGADDYVTKPFSLKVLFARVNALIRRKNEHLNSNNEIQFKEILIHPGKREVKVGNKKIELTFSEFQILYLLAGRPNIVFTRQQIIDEIHGINYHVTDRSIDFQIVGLRQKLGKAKNHIKTVRGVGYKFNPDQ
ncbi:MAG: response regulator transcription factor [Candidatus Neomarinimicrobiota bacterium]|jgi:two-component system phosphate regulon response regulator PhoB|nr:response regulator transcription factor [Candidatus Neomarinimicrobiota bacterium]